MRPGNDPESTKYPDRTFYCGVWRTPEQIERRLNRHLEQKRERYANDHEYRERWLERNRKRYWSDPEFRERKLKQTSEQNRERYANDPEFRLKISQKSTLREARKTLERSIRRAEDL